MTAARNRSLGALLGERGFTLVELIVVILIVGALAAIAIPMLLSQRQQATDVTAKAVLQTTAKAMSIFRDANEAFDCGDSAACTTKLRDIEPSIPLDTVRFAAPGGSGSPEDDGYRLTVEGGQGRTFWIERDGAAHPERGCALNGASQAGGCRVSGGAGSW